LGIETEEQLRTHPLRGALFENMVVNEMIKERLNAGKRPELYFYRDQSQREIDIIRMQAQYLEAYEIKSSMSFNRDFFKHLLFFKKLLPDRVRRSAVIYDGEAQIDKDIEGLYNFRNFRFK
jgi:predicted AAA+ superfamily ATPase